MNARSGGSAGKLARSRVKLVSSGTRGFFADRSVLITGAGGSIGSELAREIATLGCARLGLLDHFDHALLEVGDALRLAHPQLPITEILCDIRTPERLRPWFDRYRPDIVIHAAALKHVHLGERHPGECVMTNLVGVKNCAEAAAESGAELFVLISSDKAAAPVCVMGTSKRLAELYLEGFRRTLMQSANKSAMQLKVVRFGNVFGTQGSVVPKFLRQIEKGGPIEVTHPDMKRYFMSLTDAVRLILSVASSQESNDSPVGAHILDMGEPVKIMDLARELLQAQGSKAEIVISGLREGEKLSEQLWDEHEAVEDCAIPDVHRVAPRAPEAFITAEDVAWLDRAARHLDDYVVKQRTFTLLDSVLEREIAIAG
jgi:O-antigen biosynthesis protein WbqV